MATITKKTVKFPGWIKCKKFTENSSSPNNRLNHYKEMSKDKPKGKGARFNNVSFSPKISIIRLPFTTKTNQMILADNFKVAVTVKNWLFIPN